MCDTGMAALKGPPHIMGMCHATFILRALSGRQVLERVGRYASSNKLSSVERDARCGRFQVMPPSRSTGWSARRDLFLRSPCRTSLAEDQTRKNCHMSRRQPDAIPTIAAAQTNRRSDAPPRTSAKATIRTRAGGLPTTGVATDKRGRAHQRDFGFPAHDGRPYGCDLDVCRRRSPRVSFQIGGQRSLDCALGLDGGRPLSVHRQPSHVGAKHTRILTFDDNRKMR